MKIRVQDKLRLVFWRLAPALALVLSLGWGIPALVAQDDAGVTNEEPNALEVDSEDAMREIDEILMGDFEVWSDRAEVYEPEGRRDPFRSLRESRNQDRPLGPRPDGIPGLLIDEVDLTGLFEWPSGPVAQVQAAADDRSYLLYVGDQLYDGDVIAISRTEIVFKQILDDPTELKPFREVVKRLYPEEEDS